MKTLRQKLAEAQGKIVLDIQDAPSYIHHWEIEDGETLVVSWEDEGLIYDAEFSLDDTTEVAVWQLVEIK